MAEFESGLIRLRTCERMKVAKAKSAGRPRLADGHPDSAGERSALGWGSAYSEQSTATARAAQISRILTSATRPSRSTRIAIETLSTESRLIADRSGIGSSPGSRRTSLGRPLMVVVQGAMSARRCRGMTASRDSTTTGRRPISGISHHHTSPRAGRFVTRLSQRDGTRPGLPTRLARRGDARRTLSSWRLLRPCDDGPGAQRAPHRLAQSLASQMSSAHSRASQRQPSCSTACDSCHNHATIMRHCGGVSTAAAVGCGSSNYGLAAGEFSK